MTGGGAPGAAGILKCLRLSPEIRVTLADANPEAVGKFLNDDFVTIPPASDPGFTAAVHSICQQKKIQVVLPLVTRELIPLAQSIKTFEDTGTRILVSPAPSLEIANNKSRLYEFLQWRGLAVPEFRVVETAEQFQQAANELGYPKRPCCFKPSVSNGSRGFRVVSETINESDLLFNYKPSSTYIRMPDAMRILSSAPFPELLVSEYLPGDEYSVDCLAAHGKAILVIPRLRKKMVSGISVVGEIVHQEEIIGYCTQIIHELQLHGNIGIQVKLSEKGQFLVLEINPRVQGTIAACLGAGINLPVLAIQQEMGILLSPEQLKVKWGVKFSKYWDLVFY